MCIYSFGTGPRDVGGRCDADTRTVRTAGISRLPDAGIVTENSPTLNAGETGAVQATPSVIADVKSRLPTLFTRRLSILAQFGLDLRSALRAHAGHVAGEVVATLAVSCRKITPPKKACRKR